MTTTPAGMQEGPADFRFDFDRFERMFELGILNDLGPRVELLEGRIVQMSPIGGEHGDTSVDLAVALTNILNDIPALHEALRVSAGVTLRIGEHSAPEPDVLIARRRDGRKYYEASDAVLVIEVSVSTRDNDLAIKRPLYARAGIPELWIVEPEARLIRVFREPRPDGSWGHEAVVTEGVVTPLFSDKVRVELAELF
ncbi:MAG: Uma2 family endonuclease [Brevundimonas sp.]|uniref:Uma2 family endonuclease n=1 Tax=Brevundimonas sp. TaxID=1871086 RepID=UPI002733F568|nr:Uma2 family endonuclease [Brevundimonas sp.]MDP3370672.1 Uma2 family endonuclease [Brevundimonas sp.]MDP3657174.1 Uma2 family endonuclease [Brevundimonas sp.]MDZ4112911.1 Uma2 family endonuclease [Brevundimonas sp.]